MRCRLVKHPALAINPKITAYLLAKKEAAAAAERERALLAEREKVAAAEKAGASTTVSVDGAGSLTTPFVKKESEA